MFLAHVFASLALAISTVVDLRIREVPDTVSFGTMGVAVVLGSMTALVEQSLAPFWTMFLGLLLGAAIGLFMFFAGQWGGGDAKLIMGLGGLFGLGTFFYNFLIFTVFAGAFYGLAYSTYLAFKNRKEFGKAFKKRAYTKPMKIIRAVFQFVVFTALILAFFLIDDYFTRIVLVLVAAGSYFLFYAWLFAKVLEESCMKKMIPVKDLVEGDWIINDISLRGKVICKKDKLTLQKIKLVSKMFNQTLPFVEVSWRLKSIKIPIKRKIRINKLKSFHFVEEKVLLGNKKLEGYMNQKNLNLLDNYLLNNDFLIKVKTFFGIRDIYPFELTPNSKLVEDIKIRKLIYGRRNIGALKKDILRLQKSSVKKVLVKEGIPFVPSFLIAYLMALYAASISWNFF